MSENFWKYYEQPKNRDNESISVFDDAKYTKQKEGFYNKIKNNLNQVNSLKDFIWKQNQDKQKLWEYIKNLEKITHNETRENLDKEIFRNEIKIFLYEKLWIDNEQQNNSSIENFIKWVIDWWILDNYDLLLQIYKSNWKIILDWLSELASWEWINKLIEAIWEDINTLWEWNTYEKWKVSAEVVLWLLTVWVWVTANIAKKWVKIWIKNIRKLRKPSERVVESAQAKNIIWETKKEVDDIVPKKELDFENKLKNNLSDEQINQLNKIKQKLEDKEFIKNRLNLEEFEKLDIDWKLESLWIPKEFSDLLNESWLLPKNFSIIERYKELQYRDKIFKNKEVINYQLIIEKAIEKYPDLTKTEALLIFASTDKFLFGNMNWLLRWEGKISEWQEKLMKKLDDWLDKMPNLDWKHIIRWENHHSWVSKNEVKRNGNILSNVEIKELINDWDTIWLIRWDNILLDAYTFVSNNKNDIFIWKDFPKNDTLIIIKWADWIVKDISPLSMYGNFWEKILERNTDFEWMIKRWTNLEFIDSRIILNAKFNDWDFIKKILIVRVKK